MILYRVESATGVGGKWERNKRNAHLTARRVRAKGKSNAVLFKYIAPLMTKATLIGVLNGDFQKVFKLVERIVYEYNADFDRQYQQAGQK